MAGLLDDVMAEEAAEAEARAAGGGGAAPPPPPHKRFLSEGREFPGQMWAFLADGAGILVGSMTGVTSVTVYLESAAGVEDGGRTGVVALTVAALFSVALFFSPILASIPPYATGPALVLVGALLVAHVDRIDWEVRGALLASHSYRC
jgi:xanthine/uracil/vitamin C permease (AzgA family)